MRNLNDVIYNKEYRKRVRKRNKEFIQSVKNKPCMDCGGVFHFTVMEFDHKYDKKFNLANIRANSIKQILNEISKCDLVCANCHRMRTWKRKSEQSGLEKRLDKDLFTLPLNINGLW